MHKLSDTQTILIVEDSDDDFEAMIRAFKKADNFANPIKRCEDGQQALDYLRNQGIYRDKDANPRPGVVLLDLNMPGIDGRAVLKEVKSNPDLKNIPIIVLTTSDDERDVMECYEMGANTYVRKPVDLISFMRAIQNMQEYWFHIAILPRTNN